MGSHYENLIVNIDVNNEKSKISDSELISLNKWRYSKSFKQNIYDYGLTAFDNGTTDKMESTKEILTTDNVLVLNRVGKNIVDNPTKNEIRPYSATTIYDEYGIQEISDDLGRYFNLDGGYFQGFFKLEGYDYEVLPTRYEKGITIENLLFINENSQGLFFTIGVRSEDKYNPHYEGETEVENVLKHINVRYDTLPYYANRKEIVETPEYEERITKHVATSENEGLHSIREAWEYNNAVRLYETELKKEINYQPNNWENIENNIIGFGLSEDKKLYYQYISDDALKINYSKNQITHTGHTLITIVYEPIYELETKDLLCHKRRTGTLYFYVNGSLFWDVKNIPEPIFRGINNDKTKQIGVPYSISWGGGTFGLKNSYHFDSMERFLYENQDDDYINSNFSVDKQNFILTNASFQDKETIKLYKNDDEPINSLLVSYNSPIKILPNRSYVAKLNVFSDNFFKNSKNNKIKISVFDSDNNNISILNDSYIITNNKWCEVNVEFKTIKNFGSEDINFVIEIESDKILNENKPLYFSEITYSGVDILVSDERKNNLFIQRNFDKPFIGGIQKLKIYDDALPPSTILINTKTENLSAEMKMGGRIIYDSMVKRKPTPPVPPKPTIYPIYLGYLTPNQGTIINENIASGITYPTQVVQLDYKNNHQQIPNYINCEWKNVFTDLYQFIAYTQFLAIDKTYLTTPYLFYQNIDFVGSTGLYDSKGSVETILINNIDYWIFKLFPTAPLNYTLFR